ncbi:unnamed protein product, partial [Rotaria sp. Silwood2]
NVNQTCFEILTKIVQCDILAGLNDAHGTNHVLLAYIHYQCRLCTPTETDMTVFSLKSASLRPSSFYFQHRVTRSRSKS